MNRGVFQSSPVMGGSSAWWNLNSMIRPPQQEIINPSPLLHHPLPMPSPWQEIQELPESWSQLLLGGLAGEEERCSFSALLQHKRLEENFEDPMVEVKQESPESGYVYGNSSSDQEIQMTRYIPVASSPRSCVTTFSSSMLDFSNSTTKVDPSKHPKPVLSPECNSTATGATYKKARVQGSSSAQSTFKVRKEKLGDRITALHQLVSPFGKTDTASVLLEAIGYIRFLQNQIEALSSPYLGNAPSSTRPPSSEIENEQKKDLRSRGLCLVPLSCTMHVENDNGTDFWAPTIGGAYR